MRSRNIRAERGFGGGGFPGHPPGIAGAATLCIALLVAASGAGAPADDASRSCCEEAERHRGYPVVPAADLAGQQLQKVYVRHDVLRGRNEGRDLELVVGSPFYRLGGEVHQLANPAYVRDGHFWVPVELVRRLTGEGVADGKGSTDDGAEQAVRANRGPWKVVIDPGHGGRDPGARGPSGTLEKDVVLAIARRMKQRLEERDGIEAVLTRHGDDFVPLAERSRSAVREGADLFLSLHANSARNRRARGFETYFLGEARTERAREVAMRENASVRYEEDGQGEVPDDLQVILANLDLRGYQRESSFVAGMVQNALRGRRSAPDRGVKQNIFLVLVNASGSMPAVLVEAGFLSNPRSERALTDEGDQDEIASGLAEAVERYFQERERRESVQTASRR